MLLVSICTRRGSVPKELNHILDWATGDPGIHVQVAYDAESIYKGHSKNLADCPITLVDNDLVILCHDDIEIISSQTKVKQLLQICQKPETGFVGVAGATFFGTEGIWWNARRTKESRGFVFQGDSEITMTPNYFGPYGQVVVLDGCFLAASFRTIKKVGLAQPKYLTSNWDYYDIYLTLKAHMMGLNNYAVPIIIRHSSPGEMRKGWYDTRQEFLREHRNNLPCKIPLEKTHGIPY